MGVLELMMNTLRILTSFVSTVFLTLMSVLTIVVTAHADEIEHLDAPAHYPGIPILTFDQARPNLTEFGSEYFVRANGRASVKTKILRNGYNTALRLKYRGVRKVGNNIAVHVSVFGALENRLGLPDELRATVTGYSFRARSKTNVVPIRVESIDRNGQVIHTQMFEVGADMSFYSAKFQAASIAALIFIIDEKNDDTPRNGTLIFDDFYLLDGSTEAFHPPLGNEAMLKWLKESALRYYIWQYREVEPGHGVVLKEGKADAGISVSGLGIALTAYVIAEKDGFVTQDMARKRTLAILRYLHAQNWFDGSAGWHGFPYHYFKQDGSPLWPRVSTIDWAMCAAGIRVIRQEYQNDVEITELATELLARADWAHSIDDKGKIVMGFDYKTGEPNAHRWGLSFSEETELVYLEAVASGKVDPEIYQSIVRKKKGIFYPSWFGSGFVYNWMQLWTGPMIPFARNSRRAYLYDAKTSQTVFGKPIMGLTAVGALTEVNSDGFVSKTHYFGRQGSEAHATDNASEVVRVAPAPYGAALALSFTPNEALTGLRQFVELGYYHPYLGLPDSVRLAGLPRGMMPTPSWLHHDLNIGPMALAIDQYQKNTIGPLYTSDPAVRDALKRLTQSVQFKF